MKKQKYEFLNSLFKKNSDASNLTIRRRAIQDMVIPYQCENCNNNGIWHNNPLTLELHHRDGDNQNNEIKNLVFLCPNCHSQTETWRKRKKKS